MKVNWTLFKTNWLVLVRHLLVLILVEDSHLSIMQSFRKYGWRIYLLLRASFVHQSLNLFPYISFLWNFPFWKLWTISFHFFLRKYFSVFLLLVLPQLACVMVGFRALLTKKLRCSGWRSAVSVVSAYVISQVALCSKRLLALLNKANIWSLSSMDSHVSF